MKINQDDKKEAKSKSIIRPVHINYSCVAFNRLFDIFVYRIIDSPTNIKQMGGKSVLNTSTQITKVLQKGNKDHTYLTEVLSVLESNKQQLGTYYVIFMIMLRTGCRITEVLNISSLDISENGSFLIKTLKRGNDRVEFVQEAFEYFMRCRSCYVDPFTHFNRFQAYRHLKNLGIGKLKAGRTNSSITHVFRDHYVRNVRSISDDKATISRTIGHRSQESTEYYGKD